MHPLSYSYTVKPRCNRTIAGVWGLLIAILLSWNAGRTYPMVLISILAYNMQGAHTYGTI